ncbi:PTS transporter subunit EIIB [Caviibacter abscessus]|uniref:PTS transporter subunit EIIB n=1 Tax=Caviibacter abscessus TaxID=1766719 RepID=UPI00083819F6|nr:PTS transporter subunit EIIB [Caviibacter abscessus]
MLKLENIISGLGGVNNIDLIDNCMTKLRIRIKDSNKVARNVILSSGVKDVLIFDNDVHIPIGVTAKEVAKSLKSMASKRDSDIIVEALGGRDNIEDISSCMTKLRVNLFDMSKIDKEKILSTIAKDVLILDKDIHIVIGTDAKKILSEII